MFYFGVDYYPEHWPEKRWPVDANLMVEVGFNVVRLGEFAWSKIEEQEGCFDFTWLDRAIQALSARGLRVVLGTPTASPPAWLMSAHTGLYRVREDGQTVSFGNRREYCPNHPVYRDYSRRIVEQMAEHYANHPAVIGWQIDNEFGDRCYCPVCQKAFQNWLIKRYCSLDALNQKWGTIFWSHTYTDWAQIPLPHKPGGSPNPGLALDFARFSSDSYVSYQKMQAEILRQKCVGHFITHNFMGFDFDQINYYELAKDLDMVCLDNYPRDQWKFTPEANARRVALQHDTMRGLKGKNFWVMEEQVGQGGWEVLSVAPRPGEARLWAYQSIAHGADAILFFRWRSVRFGTEQFWQGLLDYDGEPTRRYEELKKMGAEIARIGDTLQGSTVHPKIAFILSYDSRYAFQVQPNNPRFSYSAHFYQLYEAFYSHNVAIDLVNPEADLSGYQLVIAPALYVLAKSAADNLRRYVSAGGVLFLTPRSGVKDESNSVVEQPFPGLLADIAGLEVELADSLPDGMRNSIEFSLPELGHTCLETGVFCEVLRAKGARVIARYTQDFYAGKPAITQNQHGQGQVVYAGTIGDDQFYRQLAAWLIKLAGIQPLLEAPGGVEVAERWQGDRRWLFLLNHTRMSQLVRLDGKYHDLLMNSPVADGIITIQPHGVVILIDRVG
jgi:beta-galactosidase